MRKQIIWCLACCLAMAVFFSGCISVEPGMPAAADDVSGPCSDLEELELCEGEACMEGIIVASGLNIRVHFMPGAEDIYPVVDSIAGEREVIRQELRLEREETVLEASGVPLAQLVFIMNTRPADVAAEELFVDWKLVNADYGLSSFGEIMAETELQCVFGSQRRLIFRFNSLPLLEESPARPLRVALVAIPQLGASGLLWAQMVGFGHVLHNFMLEGPGSTSHAKLDGKYVEVDPPWNQDNNNGDPLHFVQLE